MRNPCKECDYYRKENNTCQSKKCSPRGGDGTVTIWDRLFCKPYKRMKGADRKTEQTGDNLSAVEDEPLTCDGNCWMKKQNGEWLCEHCQREPKDEQTERSSE